MLTSREMKALEQNSVFYGVGTAELMRNAGKAVAEHALKLKPKKVLVVCGTGNNGGDGFAAASILAKKTRTAVILLGSRENVRRFEAKLVLLDLVDVPVYEAEDKKDLSRAKAMFSGADLIIDAIFGTGLRGPVGEPHRTAIQLINRSGAKKISVDIPSGLDPDTGKGTLSVKPDITLTFHDAKPGLKGRKYKICDIGIPKEAVALCGPGDLSLALKPREKNTHKGAYGRVLVVGGSRDLVGAPALAALSALSLGADISAVASVEDVAETVNTFSPDLITYKLTDSDCLSLNDLNPALSLAKKFDAIVLGPGISQEAADFSREFTKKCPIPMVIDADALKALSRWPKMGRKKLILTPHAKEYEILAGQAKPRDFAKEKGVTVLKKGPMDLITDGTKTKYCSLGNPRMTVGGTGDVLAGACATLLAQCKEPFKAACGASFLNKYAGDLLYADYGITYAASDLPKVFHRVLSLL